ncbi:hypothetical protein N7462_009288 [Penicillium macrosclerotiorum]|uniref:uncharacterized protein n=1 Tax=Penicillium macrosclerotiorum TaxID=303699 RepID=UPI002549861B|nr:uncharacterized protein N7462_009288 [Penicillium macrosclerotiorum]KAJ5673849.1 hypothetical protein N7462_009288 [Penicillium macrosclerotiorum]
MANNNIQNDLFKDNGRTTAIDVNSTGESNADRELHFAKRGEALSEASSIQESIEGYNPELMSGRTLLTTEEEKRLLRKIDWRLMTLCSLIFMFKNLDSNNASNARIMNKGTDQNIMAQLGITSNEYSLITVCYYAEAGQFPGVILQMTYWYRPDEMSLRLLYFYICGNVSGIFGGLLAYAFDTVSGAGGLSGWQWLFLTEGIATVLFGILIWFLLPDFPETAKWLTEREKKFIQARLPSNSPRANEGNFKFREVVDSLKDIRLWLFTLIWATFTVGTNGVTFYQSTVIADLGFTSIAQAQLLNIPITVCGLLFIAATGITADRSRIPRPLYPLSFLVIIMACYGVFVAYPSTGAVYAVTLIGNALTAGWYPVMWPWRVQTTSRATGSAFSIGFVNSYGQIGGAIGPQIFRSEYAPHYTLPFSVAIGLVGLCAILTLVTWWVTRETERDTRRLKLAKLAAEKRGEIILEDVVDNDLKHNQGDRN